MLSECNKILVIAAHPDDEILGVGGTMSILNRLNKCVDVLIATDGSSTQYVGDEFKLQHKFVEAAKANKIIGSNLLPPLPFPDMKLDTLSHVEKNTAISQIIQDNGYDTVFVQNLTDINMDHQELFKSTAVACRPYPSQKVKRLFSYYVNSSSDWGNILTPSFFKPNVFIELPEEDLQNKLKAMGEYKTELRDYPHPRSIQSIQTSAMYFGNMAGYNLAEPFKLIMFR